MYIRTPPPNVFRTTKHSTEPAQAESRATLEHRRPAAVLTCHVRAVSPGVDDDGKDIAAVVHVHPEVEACHVAETAVLAQLLVCL